MSTIKFAPGVLVKPPPRRGLEGRGEDFSETVATVAFTQGASEAPV